MRVTEVKVQFEALISDGQYGNERVSIGMTAALPEQAGETEAHVAAMHLTDRCREAAYARLKQSPRDGIRHALETEEERERRYIFERAKDKAEYAQRQAQREQWRREADQQYGLDKPDDESGESDEDEESPF